MFHLPHLPVSALTNHRNEVEVAPEDLLLLLHSVRGCFRHRHIQIGLLLRVVDFYHVRQRLLHLFLHYLTLLHLLLLQWGFFAFKHFLTVYGIFLSYEGAYLS